jgi:hypothetical protein
VSSRAHDFIVAALARKARELGFAPVALDGRQQLAVGHRLAIPKAVLRHRPDLVAVRADGRFCIGEAKLPADLRTQRTKEQFSDFVRAAEACIGSTLLVGVPLSAKTSCEEALAAAGAVAGSPVETLLVPDALLPNEDEV